MSNKLLNSALVSSEELWRTRRVLSSDDTQPHSIIVKYSPSSEWEMYPLDVFCFFFSESDLLKVDQILGLTFLKGRIQNGVLPFTTFTVAEISAQWIFTTSVYSRRGRRFVNSAFPNKKSLAQKSKFIYDKQK